MAKRSRSRFHSMLGPVSLSLPRFARSKTARRLIGGGLLATALCALALAAALLLTDAGGPPAASAQSPYPVFQGHCEDYGDNCEMKTLWSGTITARSGTYNRGSVAAVGYCSGSGADCSQAIGAISSTASFQTYDDQTRRIGRLLISTSPTNKKLYFAAVNPDGNVAQLTEGPLRYWRALGTNLDENDVPISYYTYPDAISYRLTITSGAISDSYTFDTNNRVHGSSYEVGVKADAAIQSLTVGVAYMVQLEELRWLNATNPGSRWRSVMTVGLATADTNTRGYRADSPDETADGFGSLMDPMIRSISPGNPHTVKDLSYDIASRQVSLALENSSGAASQMPFSSNKAWYFLLIGNCTINFGLDHFDQDNGRYAMTLWEGNRLETLLTAGAMVPVELRADFNWTRYQSDCGGTPHPLAVDTQVWDVHTMTVGSRDGTGIGYDDHPNYPFGSFSPESPKGRKANFPTHNAPVDALFIDKRIIKRRGKLDKPDNSLVLSIAPFPGGAFNLVLCVDGRALAFDQSDLSGAFYEFNLILSDSDHGLVWNVGQEVKVSLWQVLNKSADHTGRCAETAQTDNSPAAQPDFSADLARPTTAEAGPDLTGAPGETVTLQGRDSHNPYGKWYQLAHAWKQLSGPEVELSDATRGDPSFTIPADAAYGTTLTFRLTVTDREGVSASDETTVTVAPPTPTPPTACAGDDLEAQPGDTVTLEGTCSTNPHGVWWRLAHLWTQPEGQNIALSNPTKGKPTFTMPTDATPGTVYTFTLTVTDKDGESDSDSMTVTVPGGTTGESQTVDPPPNQAPVFDAGIELTRSIAENSPAGTNVGAAITATDPDDDTITYSLSGTDAASFGIGSETGQLTTISGVTYDYETKSSYTLAVDAKDGNGGAASVAITVTLAACLRNRASEVESV